MSELSGRNFRMEDNETDGNISFREQEGATHEYRAANQYVYNGLRFFWNSGKENDADVDKFTLESTVGEVLADEAFEDFGRLLFPVDRTVPEGLTLEEVSSADIYIRYSNIQPEKTVEIVNYLKENAQVGEKVFYNIYTEEEIAADASRQDTGLFFFRGDPGEKFAVMNAGGGFSYVGAMHDSFPHALEVSKMGYNTFALIYRPDSPYEDQAAAVIMQYTGYTSTSAADAPTYACVGTSDGIADWTTMENRLKSLNQLGIPTEFHSYEGLRHGFGLGAGTVADGWINDAVAFWESNM